MSILFSKNMNSLITNALPDEPGETRMHGHDVKNEQVINHISPPAITATITAAAN